MRCAETHGASPTMIQIPHDSHSRRRAYFCDVPCGFPRWRAELELRYAAIERADRRPTVLAGGRLLRSRQHQPPSASSPIWNLRIVGAAAPIGRAIARLRRSFSGRTALDMFGALRGHGRFLRFHDDLRRRWRSKGAIAMDDVHVSTLSDSYYIRRVRQALTEQLLARISRSKFAIRPSSCWNSRAGQIRRIKQELAELRSFATCA